MFVQSAKDVFEDYEIRRVEDETRMKKLGSEGFARRDEFLLPIGPEVGWFLHSLIVARKPKRILEFGTSYGYSTLFLADAAKKVGATVTSYELAKYKQEYAREKMEKAELSNVVDFQVGDAVEKAQQFEEPVDFVLIDIWKSLYIPCFDAVYTKLSENAIICADNMISPALAREDVREYRSAVRSKSDLQTTLFPIGSGVEISIKWSANNPDL